MFKTLVLVKTAVVLVVMGSGVVFLLQGLGAEIPFLKYGELEVYRVPVGVILLLVGLGVLRFWKIEYSKKPTASSVEFEESATFGKFEQ